MKILPEWTGLPQCICFLSSSNRTSDMSKEKFYKEGGVSKLAVFSIVVERVYIYTYLLFSGSNKQTIIKKQIRFSSS